VQGLINFTNTANIIALPVLVQTAFELAPNAAAAAAAAAGKQLEEPIYIHTRRLMAAKPLERLCTAPMLCIAPQVCASLTVGAAKHARRTQPGDWFNERTATPAVTASARA